MPSQNSLLNRKQRFIVLKVMAMLSLVRWYNILLVSLGLELSAVFLLNPETEWLETLLDYKLHFLIA
ncbi:MAG: hypothetical protein ACI9J3_000705, partial [Parvicellaceae bacterium]